MFDELNQKPCHLTSMVSFYEHIYIYVHYYENSNIMRNSYLALCWIYTVHNDSIKEYQLCFFLLCEKQLAA